jgi:hypothetical protein
MNGPTKERVNHGYWWRCLPSDVNVIEVESDLQEFPDAACSYCRTLQHIDFRQARQLEAIGKRAFQSCTSLLSINLVGTITNVIKENAFSYCSALRDVVFNRELREIADDAFWCCTNLQIVDFSNAKQVSKIGDGAFFGCPALKRVTIPSSIQHFEFVFREEDVESVGIQGTITLPLAIRLSTAYPNSTPTITMDLLLSLYSFRRIQPYDLLLPHHVQEDDEGEDKKISLEPHFHLTEDQVKLDEIRREYPERIRRLVLWCIEKGVMQRNHKIDLCSGKG